MRVWVFCLALLQGGMVLAAGSASEQVATLTVSGMTCPVCPLTVRKALQGVSGVTAVQVDYASKTAEVHYDPARATTQELRQATANAGYPSQLAASAGSTAPGR